MSAKTPAEIYADDFVKPYTDIIDWDQNHPYGSIKHITTGDATMSAKTNFLNNYLKTCYEVIEWSYDHPYAFYSTTLLLNATAIGVGAYIGGWSVTGVLKFWLAATLTSIVVNTPTYKLVMRATK